MIHINSVYQTQNSGPLIVIEKTPRTDFYIVQFLNTKTIKTVRGYQIKNGCVKDPYAKLLCGVGATGNIKTKGKYAPYYRIWHDMINRCYNPKDKHATAYSNVTVAETWLIFENFYYDVKNIEGFDEQKFLSGEIVLDKDIKQRQQQHKYYSKDTCVWVSKHDNNQIQDHQQKPFIAISPSGEKYHETNITDFARKHNLNRKHISGILHKRGKTTRGWTFTYEEIV